LSNVLAKLLTVISWHVSQPATERHRSNRCKSKRTEIIRNVK